MNPSSSHRPTSSHSQRSESRASRPTSSMSNNQGSEPSRRQPGSNLQRPASSASLRPISRVSQRPGSRQSRPLTRQTSRLLSKCQTLVAQVTGITAPDDDRFEAALDYACAALEHTTKAPAGVDMKTIDKQIEGHVHKGRIHSRDAISDALDASYRLLKAHITSDDSNEQIRISRLPDHLRLLMCLSLPPSHSTTIFAEDYVERLRSRPWSTPKLTWKEILAEEPFSGQHWEGAYGLPPESTVEKWETCSGGSSPSLSPLSASYDDESDSASSLECPAYDVPPEVSTEKINGSRPSYPQSFSHREEVENLEARQYWRPSWHIDAPLHGSFSFGDLSTFGPSMSRTLGERTTLIIGGPEREHYINESDAVREILIAMQGRKNILLTWSSTADGHAFVPSPSAPRLVHITVTAFASLLSSFAAIATVLEHLRKLMSCVKAEVSQASAPLRAYTRRLTRTFEAFSDAVDQEIISFDTWCANKETEICQAHAGVGPSLVISLLSLEDAVRRAFSDSYTALLDVLRIVLTKTAKPREKTIEVWLLADLPARVPPATATCLLLDTLLQALQTYWSMADNLTCNTLMRVFTKTAEPIWAMIGRWLKDGMPVRDIAARRKTGDIAMDEEFFIEDNEMSLLEAEFWVDGYALRGGMEFGDGNEDDQKSIPSFLARGAEAVLASGKAVGLLRTLGIPLSVDDDGKEWLSAWRSFKALLASNTAEVPTASSFPLATDTLIRTVYDELLPHYETTGALLADVIIKDCGFPEHLFAIEGILLMRRGDAMSHYLDLLFAKMDSHQQWNDFHFLNSAFASVVEAQKTKWVETALVRFAYRGSKDKSTDRTVRALDGLVAEYAVPFPLIYLFTPRILHIYSSIFVFLLQVHRAKTSLERFLLRGAFASAPQNRTELKSFYAIRSRLSWFINTLLNYLTTYVIHTEVVKFHAGLQETKSFDSIIDLHSTHVDKMQSRCLLKANTSALHRAVISILDVCLRFSDFFVAFAGDTTMHDISRTSIVLRRHKSRRRRRQLRNVIGFAEPALISQYSSDEDTDEDDEDDEDYGRTEPSISLRPTDEGFFDQFDRMSTELDGLVRFVRRGVENLAGRGGEGASTFGVLAFALEDWDL